jgi:hypothetical protein
MTFYFSTIMATSTLMLRNGAWTGGPRTHKTLSVKVFFEIGSLKLFALAGFELRSS